METQGIESVLSLHTKRTTASLASILIFWSGLALNLKQEIEIASSQVRNFPVTMLNIVPSLEKITLPDF